MLLSVVIPVYNAADFIQKSYESILDQEIEDFELIYVDNNSTDNSLDKIAEIAAIDTRIQVCSEKKQGAAPTRNKGIQHAKGKYIYLFDVDDEIFPNALRNLLGVLESDHRLDAVFGKMIKSKYSISETLKPTDETFELQLKKAPFWGLKWFSDLKSVVGPPAFLYRTSVFKTIGSYNEALRIGQDTAFDIKLGMRCNIAFLDMYIYLYFKHDASTIQRVKSKIPRAFMMWPRLVQEHLPFYLEQETPLKFKTLLFAQLYQAMARQICFTKGFGNRSVLKNSLMHDLEMVKVPTSIQLYLSILVLLPLEPLRKIYGYYLVPMVINKIKA